jgi:hypothetical protein
MLKTSEIRQSIIEKLRNDITDFEVMPFPNKPQDFVLTHPKGALLVAFDGLNFSEPATTQQFFTLTINITLCFNSTIDSESMLNDIDRVRQALTNEYYAYGSKFYCVSIMPLGEEDNIWYYKLKFILPGLIMQGE